MSTTSKTVIFIISVIFGTLVGGSFLGCLVASFAASAVMALLVASRRPNPMAQHSHREAKHRG